MSSARATIWKDAPEPTTVDRPAIFFDTNKSTMWLAYAYCEAPSKPLRYAVVRFLEVIDQRLSPINDEGLGQHRYYKAGLEFYSFNELTGTEETKYWAALKARHWVVTFQDNTLDVIAEDAQVMATDLEASDSASALMDCLRERLE